MCEGRSPNDVVTHGKIRALTAADRKRRLGSDGATRLQSSVADRERFKCG